MSQPQRAQYHDPNSRASDAVGVSVDDAKMKLLCPELYGFWSFVFGSKLAQLKEHVKLGDSRAALVVSINPLLIAAYTDELDCVAMLNFPQEFVAQYQLQVGTPLLTINTYFYKGKLASDLTLGPQQLGRYPNVHPVIAEFVSNDFPQIAARKQGIARAEWERCYAMGMQYLQQRPGVFRNGSPSESLDPHNEVWIA